MPETEDSNASIRLAAKRRYDEISNVLGETEGIVKKLRIEQAKLKGFLSEDDSLMVGNAPSVHQCESFVASIESRKATNSLQNVPYLLKLKKFDTPTISNGIELITQDPLYGKKGFNLERVLDHMEDWNTVIGYAITVKIQPSKAKLVNAMGANRQKFADHVAQVSTKIPPDMPKIIVVEDMDVRENMVNHGRPYVYGSMWGEVNANFFAKMGVKGCLVDGAVRDIPEMRAAGFRALSRTLSPSHSYGGVPLEWDIPVEVFGSEIQPGALLAMDRHGFQVIPRNLEANILEAVENGDKWERDYTIVSSWSAAGTSYEDVNERMKKARGEFGKAKNDAYGSFETRMGGKEWTNNL